MTGREIIHKLVETCDNLDNEVPFYILKRDENGCIITREKVGQIMGSCIWMLTVLCYLRLFKI